MSPLGCLQGGQGCVGPFPYKPNGFIDYVLEGYSGVHDTLNQRYFYNVNGTNRLISHPIGRYFGNLLNLSNVLFATPIVVPSLVPVYLRHFYFQVGAK